MTPVEFRTNHSPQVRARFLALVTLGGRDRSIAQNPETDSRSPVSSGKKSSRTNPTYGDHELRCALRPRDTYFYSPPCVPCFRFLGSACLRFSKKIVEKGWMSNRGNELTSRLPRCRLRNFQFAMLHVPSLDCTPVMCGIAIFVGFFVHVLFFPPGMTESTCRIRAHITSGLRCDIWRSGITPGVVLVVTCMLFGTIWRGWCH